jgi:hypothetical protein
MVGCCARICQLPGCATDGSSRFRACGRMNTHKGLALGMNNAKCARYIKLSVLCTFLVLQHGATLRHEHPKRAPSSSLRPTNTDTSHHQETKGKRFRIKPKGILWLVVVGMCLHTNTHARSSSLKTPPSVLSHPPPFMQSRYPPVYAVQTRLMVSVMPTSVVSNS